MDLKDLTSEQLISLCEVFHRQLQRIVVNTEQILASMKTKLDMGFVDMKQEVDKAETVSDLGDLFAAQVAASQEVGEKINTVFAEIGTRPVKVIPIPEPVEPVDTVEDKLIG